jgi:triosephosphate isomerase
MRKLLLAGNWKMNLIQHEAASLAAAIAAELPADCPHDVALCPPTIYLTAVSAALEGSTILLGAQDMYHEDAGAFTGETSGPMLSDLGVEFVILGHSERRHIIGEDDGLINRKLQAALRHQLSPILCVGETLDQREAGQTAEVVRSQIEGSLAGLSAAEMLATTIAYEPVWAIGTGRVATPEEAQQVHADLRSLIESRYNPDISQQVRIQYGGSVKPDNAAELLSQPDIDGALVGGASLTTESFIGIIQQAALV